MNRIDNSTLEGIRTKTKAPKSSSKTMTPREEAAPKVHQDEKGKPFIPAENLLSCLIGAGQSVRLDGKRQVSTAKSTTLPAFMTIEDTHLELFDPEDDLELETAKWEVDMRAGRNPNGGELVCLCRPRFDRWAFKVRILVDEKEIAEDKIRELFDKAGKRNGLGDFRPSRKGMFGQFVVKCWEKQRKREAA